MVLAEQIKLKSFVIIFCTLLCTNYFNMLTPTFLILGKMLSNILIVLQMIWKCLSTIEAKIQVW